MESNSKNSQTEKVDQEYLDRDSANLGNILPTEIWEMVTTKLNKSENLINSSPYYRKLLASQKTLILFQCAFALVISTLWKTKENSFLPLNDILKCRQVCKTWRIAIDTMIKNCYHITNERNAIQEKIQSTINYHLWYDADSRKYDLFRFLDFFQESHPGQPEKRSPFIFPKVTVSTPDSNDYDDEHEEGLREYDEKLTTLFLKYGTHITDFTLSIDGPILDFKYATRLQKWLISTPNLKRITIIDRSEYLENESNEFDEFSVKTPYPTLQHLESMDIRYLKTPLFNNLIMKNNHISKLHAKEGEEEFDLFTFPMKNLKELKLKLSTDTLDIIDKIDSPNVTWPLTSLSISFGKVHDYLWWSEFFQLVEQKFASTLLKFSLKLPQACSERGGIAWRNSLDPLKLYLPKLQEIYLSTCMPIRLDFLLPMKDNLKLIFVRARYTLLETLDGKEKYVVDFYGFESGNKILDSNIWTIFTKLEKMGIRVGCMGVTWYTR